MDNAEIMHRIEEMEREIGTEPAGSLAVKRINGREYFYHRTSTDGKRKERYVSPEEAERLRAGMERRRAAERELRRLKALLPAPVIRRRPAGERQDGFSSYVRTGERLKSFASVAEKYRKRECYGALRDYVFGGHTDRVFVLYGLRRTGKTTMIRQVLLEMTDEQLRKAAFLQVRSGDTISSVNGDLARLEERGYRYVFIDEATLLDDFIEGAALFPDIYAASGMRIVLSGTDSLGFLLARSDQLFDRTVTVHTTFIPYREFENVLGIRGVDEYIRHGGTMSLSGARPDGLSVFADAESADRYVDGAIARNIQHSLEHYQDGGHFRSLYELYRKNELTGAINRVVEDMNHRFTREVLTRTFRSGDLALSARNLLHDREKPLDLLRNIDEDSVNASIKTMLEILDENERTVPVREEHAFQIEEYLSMLDLIFTVDEVSLPYTGRPEKKTIVSQPGLRYAQAGALIESLLSDRKFGKLPAEERLRVRERVLTEIRGRMTEDIVLLETALALPEKEVFKLQFAAGEFDMVIFDPDSLTCEIFEIKHGSEIVPAQYTHLTNPEKCAATEHRYGTISGRYVIYGGAPAAVRTDGPWTVQYLNVEDYLNKLGDKRPERT